jgi:hypothetical protein
MVGKDSENPRGPAPTGLPKASKLPKSLQNIVDKDDKEENFYDELYEGQYVLRVHLRRLPSLRNLQVVLAF